MLVKTKHSISMRDYCIFGQFFGKECIQIIKLKIIKPSLGGFKTTCFKGLSFKVCLGNMVDPQYLRLDYLEPDEIFPECLF